MEATVTHELREKISNLLRFFCESKEAKSLGDEYNRTRLLYLSEQIKQESVIDEQRIYKIKDDVILKIKSLINTINNSEKYKTSKGIEKIKIAKDVFYLKVIPMVENELSNHVNKIKEIQEQKKALYIAKVLENSRTRATKKKKENMEKDIKAGKTVDPEFIRRLEGDDEKKVEFEDEDFVNEEDVEDDNLEDVEIDEDAEKAEMDEDFNSL